VPDAPVTAANGGLWSSRDNELPAVGQTGTGTI
jgi:hypothetical protein